ncbi:MAG: molybdate/tungstate transport system permease protein [Thermodesulfobacteriota bacterium]|nr:molybdate/tungstate transport system permease protein [Thermodesulfobacteriota bacterium]
MEKREPFFWLTISCGVIVMAFILLPLMDMVTAPSLSMLKETLKDRDVVRSIWLSMYTSGSAALISFVFGTPLAYLLARTHFKGKRWVESIIDLPIVIPHPVVGIAILSVAGRNHWIGQMLGDLGIRIMGSVTGIITVLTFVGLPFYINTVKAGFEGIPPRLEKVSRSLGASMSSTFFRITFPLAWRSMVIGLIMCMARAISEFGAVVIVAYHPMIAPVMIYERFEAYGLKYSQPVAVWLVLVCLCLFLALRILTLRRAREI